MKPLASMLIGALLLAPPVRAAGQIDRDSIPVSLTGTPGDAARGGAIVGNRQMGLCVLCHAGPFPEERIPATIGPNLTGIGARLTEGQIRLRVVNARHLNPDSVMPSYFNTAGQIRTAPAFQGKPILTAPQIEDVVAFLTTLRTAP